MHGGRIAHFPPHGSDAHCGGGGVGVGAPPGMQVHAPLASKSQCPRRSGQSAPGGQNRMTQSPPHAATSHSVGIVGAGAGVTRFTGTQAHAPAGVSWHSPRTAIAGHSSDPHGTGTTHEPLHMPSLHCGGGVGSGVDFTGIHSQLPFGLTSHWPRSTAGSAHGASGGHGIGAPPIRHGPPHMAPPHCGVAVGVGEPGVGVAGGAQAQSPAAVSVHWPTMGGISGALGPSHIAPGGQDRNGSKHGPPQTAPPHGGVGVGSGGPSVGVGRGWHVQPPVESATHSPMISGHETANGHGSGAAQGPPQASALHGFATGVGAAVSMPGNAHEPRRVCRSHT